MAATRSTGGPERVLIVSANMGEGHNATGRALDEAVRARWPGVDVRWLDTLDVMGRGVVLVSSADETAFAVRELLTTQGMLADRSIETHPESDPRHVFFTSGRVDTFRTLGARFLGPEVASVEPWQWG